MQNLQRFATARPLLFVILATVAWILIGGVAAYAVAGVLRLPFVEALPQSLGTLTATACLILVMACWGWLRSAGVTVLGSGRLWLLTASLAAFVVVAYKFAFFGQIPVDLSASWRAGEVQAILLRQAIVGTVEETLFRGFLLYALVRVWGSTRRGLLAAVTIPALIFGLTHILQLLSGNPLEDVLMTILNGFIGGLWYGALVLLGGSLWPAVLIHAVTNASVQIVAATLPSFDPSAADYALATAAELPLVIAGLWLLLRRTPRSNPAGGQDRGTDAFTSASSVRQLFSLLSPTGSVVPIALTLTLLLSACGGPVAPPPVEGELPGPVVERIQRVENGLIVVTEDGELEWGDPKTLAERMKHYGVPGVSIAVIDDYELEWARGYGVLEAGGNDRVTPDSLFHAGSIAKPVSAAAALALVERGLLNLDEDVNTKLVSWHVPENEYTTQEKVTLRRLLSHSSGLTDGFPMRSSSDPEFDWWSAAGEAPTLTIQQLLEAQPPADEGYPTRVMRVPGTAYQYSNHGYGVVQLLMTDVTRQPFSELMRDLVLEPLGMASSTFEQPLPENLRDRATTEHYGNGQPFEGKRHHYPYLASGGLWTTPSDLARFAIEIMGARSGASELLLSQEMASEMLTSQIEVDGSLLSDSYGLGLDLADSGREFRFLHSGGTWGSTCLLWVHPETGQGAVIMTNSASGNGAIRIEILLGIAAEYGWPLQLAGNGGNHLDGVGAKGAVSRPGRSWHRAKAMYSPPPGT